MTLPMNNTPVYTLIVPSTGDTLKYRPFFVKEEKSLLIAQQSENNTIILDTVKQVIQSCAKSELDIESLASFDIEYIFTQIRSVSVGEIVELSFKCDTCVDEKAVATITVNLQEIEIQKDPDHQAKIILFEDVGVKMKYPSLETLKRLESIDDDIDAVFNIVASCIDYIFDSEEVHRTKDIPREEVITFIEQLTTEQFNKIQHFFRTMPRLISYINYTCPVCGKVHNKYMEGMSSFF
jgi:hypothetical protein